MRNHHIQGVDLEDLFRKCINPYLKGTDFELVRGTSSVEYSYDYAIRNSYRVTHIIEIKHIRQKPSKEDFDKLRGYKVYSLMDGNELPVKVILACYNDGLWSLFSEEGEPISFEELFGSFKSFRKSPERHLRIVSWMVSCILMLIALLDYISHFKASCTYYFLTENIVMLLSVAGIFAILPFVLPRIKELRIGNIICLVFETISNSKPIV